MPNWVAAEIEAFVTRLAGYGRMLETEGGRGALEIESEGSANADPILLAPQNCY
jgi:hypothetical protein